MPRAEAQELTDEFETVDRKSMPEFAALYDIDIPMEQNEPLMAKVRELTAQWEGQLTTRVRERAQAAAEDANSSAVDGTEGDGEPAEA